MAAPFASLQSSLDPQKTNEGKPYAPQRFKEIVRECYFLTRNANISRKDVMDMTPTERSYFIEFVLDEAQKTKEHMERVAQERE